MNIMPPNNLDSTPDFLKELEQWIAWICYNMREGSDDFFPMKLSVFKVTYGKKVENFNIFLPSISKFCDTFYNSIEDVFILDESAKEYLASRGLTDIENCFDFVKNTSENINREVQNATQRIIEKEQ